MLTTLLLLTAAAPAPVYKPPPARCPLIGTWQIDWQTPTLKCAGTVTLHADGKYVARWSGDNPWVGTWHYNPRTKALSVVESIGKTTYRWGVILDSKHKGLGHSGDNSRSIDRIETLTIQLKKTRHLCQIPNRKPIGFNITSLVMIAIR